MIDRSVAVLRRGVTRSGSSLFALSLAALLAVLGALPAEAQASRTRPKGTTSGGGTAKAPASSPPAASPSSAPAPTAGASTGARTRPASGESGRTRVERDERGRSGRDVVIIGLPGWRHAHGWGWGWGWVGGYWPYGGYGPGPAWYPRRVNDRMGALDLDLKPGDTQIYLDGQSIGIADRFDGWPGYLWLEEGDYHFVFYREGYRTIAREYRIRPGLVIRVTDRMQRGESVPPEQLIPPQPTPRRDARIRRNEEMRRAAAGVGGGDGGPPDEVVAGSGTVPRAESSEDAGVGTLRLLVHPGDASVYLDGRFLGTAAEVARLRRGLAVAAGEHLLEVVRPGHLPLAREVVIADGDDLEIELTLEPRP